MLTKLIKVFTGIIILIGVTISIYPTLYKAYEKGKKTLKDQITEAELKPCIKYVEDNKEKLYLYEGATYCISNKTLVDNKYTDIADDYIVEVVYHNDKFFYRFNDDCKEK